MGKKLKTGVATLVENAKASIDEVEVEDAIAQSKEDGVLIVDIRDVRERQREGFIPGSFHCPRGMVEFWIDPDSPYYNKKFEENTRFLFHCAVDWRSALTVDTINKMGFEGASHIKGGFNAWRDQGGPVEKVDTDKADKKAK